MERKILSCLLFCLLSATQVHTITQGGGQNMWETGDQAAKKEVRRTMVTQILVFTILLTQFLIV